MEATHTHTVSIRDKDNVLVAERVHDKRHVMDYPMSLSQLKQLLAVKSKAEKQMQDGTWNA